MSRRRAANKRKGNAELFALLDEEDNGKERKEDKKGKVESAEAASCSSAAAAAALSSSSAAAAASGSSAAAASAPSASAAAAASADLAAASSSHPRGEVEEVACSACHWPFECADDAARLPRTLPRGHPMCTACCKQSLTLTPGSVLCPHEHGQLKISVPAGVAAAAVSTVDGWLRLLPPRADLIASIRNQLALMTRIGQQGAECSRPGCTAAVTHYCPDCGHFCATHVLKHHALDPFKSHKPMPIADKAAFLRVQTQSKIAGPATKIRSQAEARVLQQQRATQTTKDELKGLQEQLQNKRQELEAKEMALGALKQTADRLRAADDSTVLEMEADRLEAGGQAYRPQIDSTVLNTLSDDRVTALQPFLGAGRDLSNAKLIYRASRDGFEAKDFWRQCGGKSDLLTIVRVKGNGFVFGAFTAFTWPECTRGMARDFTDPSGETFLFSLVNGHNRAVKLRLKKDQKERAGGVFCDSGPYFGDHDVALMYMGKSATDPDGNHAWPDSYEFDMMADGGAPITYDKTLLTGDDGRGGFDPFVDFAASEIETWQL